MAERNERKEENGRETIRQRQGVVRKIRIVCLELQRGQVVKQKKWKKELIDYKRLMGCKK